MEVKDEVGLSVIHGRSVADNIAGLRTRPCHNEVRPEALISKPPSPQRPAVDHPGTVLDDSRNRAGNGIEYVNAVNSQITITQQLYRVSCREYNL